MNPGRWKILPARRRCGNTDGKPQILLIRRIGQGIGPENRFVRSHAQIEETELLPGGQVMLPKRLSLPYDEAVAGGVVAVQTFGDFQNFNPHLHIIATDGCFYGQGKFQKANQTCPADLEPLFRQEVFKLLKAHGLPDRVIENMMGWHHSEKAGTVSLN